MEQGEKYVRQGVILRKVECPLYIRRVEMSKARNKKHYRRDKMTNVAIVKLIGMKKFSDKDRFKWIQHKISASNKNVAWYWTDMRKPNEKIIANPNSHGKPKYSLVNGQYIWNGRLDDFAKNKIMDSIKDFFSEYLTGMPVIEAKEYPLAIYTEVHNVIEETTNAYYDLDNHFLMYQKAFQDTLSGDSGKRKKYILDDNLAFITQPPSPIFIPVNSPEERKLVFYIVKEEDARILRHEGYQASHIKQMKKHGDNA